MDKEVWVAFSAAAASDYNALQERVLKEGKQGVENSPDMQLLKAIDREKKNLKADPQHGTHIPRRNISKSVSGRYGTDRLWKVDLVGYWRMIYTITGDDVKIVAFVLEFMDHKGYDKVFGYRKR